MTSENKTAPSDLAIQQNNSESPSNPKRYFFSSIPIQPIDLQWKNLTVSADIKKKVLVDGKKKTVIERKVILNDVSGTIKHGIFTAIMGPSGCGKTTLLNFLSARIEHNLKIKGELRVNSQRVNDIEKIGNLVSFVQQDDILLGTVTPRELFTFTANLRLGVSPEEKKKRVNELLHDLGLEKCADTMIGNTLIRGISGGERKRTSIGVELIPNPSLIFLDEPTTGLDSTTALHILEVLKALAKSGRNVVSTIHQPSSTIFAHFDNLMLMVRGQIVYQGPAATAVNYFEKIGYPCPELTNPADFFMKLLNESGLVMDEMEKSRTESGFLLNFDAERFEEKFEKRVTHMVEMYRNSHQAEEGRIGELTQEVHNPKIFETSWFRQFCLILGRAFRNEFRNPLDLRMKFFQIIFVSLVTIAVWYKIPKTTSGIQGRTGVLFLITFLGGFGGLQYSLTTFNMERAVFIRERLSQSYRASAYFCSRVISELPWLILWPIIQVSIIYFAVELNDNGTEKFFILAAIAICNWFSSSAYGLAISTFATSVEVAMTLAPVVIVPMVVFAGFFVNQDSVPPFFWPIQYISFIKWGFQAAMINEFTDHDLDCAPTCDPLEQFDFDEGIAVSIICLIAIGIFFRIVAYIGLVKISTPKKAKIM